MQLLPPLEVCDVLYLLGGGTSPLQLLEYALHVVPLLHVAARLGEGVGHNLPNADHALQDLLLALLATGRAALGVVHAVPLLRHGLGRRAQPSARGGPAGARGAARWQARAPGTRAGPGAARQQDAALGEARSRRAAQRPSDLHEKPPESRGHVRPGPALRATGPHRPHSAPPRAGVVTAPATRLNPGLEIAGHRACARGPEELGQPGLAVLHAPPRPLP